MMKPRYTISIAVHNNLELTKKCLESIFNYSKRFQVIVIDNASTDGTEEYLNSLSSKIDVINNKTNEGFIKAHNMALQFALGYYFVVLNNDLVVCEGWLEQFDRAFQKNKNLAICGLNNNCTSLTAEGLGFVSKNIEYIEASCLMIPTYLARKHGLFSNEFLFGYCEDVDLSLRMRELGYNIGVINLPIKHERAKTTELVKHKIDIEGYHKRNNVVLLKKWQRYFQRRSFYYNVLINRQDAWGDVLLVTPLLRAIKEKNSDCSITVATKPTVIFRDNPDVNNVVYGFVSNKMNYDKVINLDMSYEYTPNRHILDSYAETSGFEITDRRIRVYPNDEERAVAKGLLSAQYRWAVIHYGPTMWAGRNYQRFNEVADLLKKDYKIAWVGQDLSRSVYGLDLRNKLTFHQLYAVIERADLFVGIDSLPMHLAQAAMRPLVGVFGAVKPEYRLLPVPFFKGVTANNVGCLGCQHYLNVGRRSPFVCMRGEEYCMTKISPEMIIDATNIVRKEYQMGLETSKIRAKVLQYCDGFGIDIGCGNDKIKPDAIGYDRDYYQPVDVIGDASMPLCFDAEYFDYVYSSHCLEDIPDTKSTLRQWLRVLKPLGCMILYLPHQDLYKGYNLDHKHDFVNADITELLNGLGCDIIVDEIDEGDNRYSMLIVARKQ